jgi:glycosyltransferase involved in cell wall biosynthesis
MKNEFQNDFGLPERLLFILNNPIDEVRIRDRASPVCMSSNTLTRFIAAGRLTDQKGYPRLLEMFACIGEFEGHLTILGDGPQKLALQKNAVALGIAHLVAFRGYQVNPWAWFAGSDCFLLPSKWEGMSNAALEALACGIPVIATPEAGGIAELAEKSSLGSVQVVAAGEPFIAAMKRMRRRKERGLSRSLLPREHALDEVVSQMAMWLIEN